MPFFTCDGGVALQDSGPGIILQRMYSCHQLLLTMNVHDAVVKFSFGIVH